MNRDEIALWGAAIGAFAGGDYVTTKQGLAAEGVEEAHPVSDVVMQTVGADAGMAAGKTIVIAAAVAGYLYARRHEETEEWAEMFPLLLIVLGLGITNHNLTVLAQV